MLSVMMLIMIMFSLTQSLSSFLNFLITIEYSLMLTMFIVTTSSSNEWVYLLFLIIGVSEAIIGLSILVKMNLKYGHQQVKIMNMCSN
uniref:NADH dehydrogenase subunit 4L n=1 Tax=Amegilla calceifera TaxID=597987 RepID=A0A7U0M7W6_9HYME|nr:NADH dehydrogenase subunit 4L [Amegilla calceifera]QQX28008.1 NADH dehydrogenase subunit 4L [Amegilla calceifera]